MKQNNDPDPDDMALPVMTPEHEPQGEKKADMDEGASDDTEPLQKGL